MSTTAGRRRRATRRRRQQDRNPSVEVIDVAVQEQPAPVEANVSCIDLTCEDDDIQVLAGSQNRAVVDLTNNSINDGPIVILGTPDSPPRRRRRGRVPVESESDDDLLELPPLPFHLPERPPRLPAPAPAAPPAAAAPTPVIQSPERPVSCPVCLDSVREIRNAGRQIMSTVCGHIFCDQCITDSIRAQKRCPSCRKKLSLRQIHPIFI